MISENFKDIVHKSYNSNPDYLETVPGLPENYKDIKTLEDLLSINYKHVSANDQLRGNLIIKLKRQQFPYSGIIGYDEDIVPSLNRAILSSHDILLVGQIGQAKTKIAETVAKNLLSPIPIVEGSITNDIPTLIPESELVSLLNDKEITRARPEFYISTETEDKIRNNRLDTKIIWIDGPSRFKYVLATPDISVKDLVGQIDAIKIAKRGVEIYNMESYSPGQLLLARHGVFCIDELPVLDPRKQVALLSVLQEGIYTTGSYPVIFKPDTRIISTANPIDYTHSGKIIEPLYDRLKSHIITRYPKKVYDEMMIMVQEANISNLRNIVLPIFILRTLAEITMIARGHPEINHEKGVSVRMSIHSLEILISEAERVRGIINNIKAVPRFSDIYSIHQTSKFELSEIDDSYENRMNILDTIISDAVKKICAHYVADLPPEKLISLKNEFKINKTFHVSQDITSKSKGPKSYQAQVSKFDSLREIMDIVAVNIAQDQKHFEVALRENEINFDTLRDTKDPEYLASVTELILEGLRFTDPPILDRKEGIYVHI
ncbi:MAG: sigma 54-interacting transcriptional regulator [Nitrososphaeraceae archaeon]|nr:sigma 54-interacting transcriptional regulator [Nitrososphaeraceae archaeon]MDW0138485.1 sigma 54-interacting transcriptional regulator [Nitrososphaeraceae archaeon]MDW0143157.1 sigma 54-interacting transcriptional regulator [Nitrososphaeraceae archaeon]MDW0143737.1 sigma 54-interacting transcriptional regulator [Nitrososphaeraceae archaeon]MDW0145321.1 sigma 54-interacting transcriptional regulator [Nitrososphaeraceae archaeon]